MTPPLLTVDGEGAGCEGNESFALMVMGQSMVPEFNEGEIIIIEPGGDAQDGSYVLAWHAGEWIFRHRLAEPVNPAFGDSPLSSLNAVRGVIIQKALPGRRNASRFYV